ncbi:hypothetical protein RhiLY_10282 [Ceratobasidium sp. AG-Ba]|nr:hypothetical protein RhiLY_10282 [Ceratobasidium sp. AG-Ba]
MFIVHVKIMGKEAARQLYAKALAAAKETKGRENPVREPSKVAEAFKKIMALNRILIELDPSGGAEVASWVCMKAWEQFRAQEQQTPMFDYLLENLASLLPTVESVRKLADANLTETLTEIENLVEDTSVFVLGVQSRSRSERTLHRIFGDARQERPDGLMKRMKRLRAEFHERVAAQTLRITEQDKLRERLKELEPARLAGYNPSHQCLDGTRLAIIDSLSIWIRTRGDQRKLAWVHGLAGLGKSSIATSMCKRLDDQHILACSFFCKRDSPELRDPRRVLTTIVCELAQRWGAYARVVSNVIAKNLALHSKHIQPLYEVLMAEPLQEIAREDYPQDTLAVVVDALDECGDPGTRKQLLMCLRHMSQTVPFLKILITSRPHEDIKAYFLGTGTDWYSELDLLQYDAGPDIYRFVEQSLSSVTSIPGCPSDAVDRVTALANGLFIWARTACAHILAGHERLKRLELLTAGKRLSAIDELYRTILTSEETKGDEESFEELRSCLGAIVVSSMNRALSVAGLAALMGEHASQAAIQSVVDRLSSVLYVDQAIDGAIRISHPSFMEYITNRDRSGDLCIDAAGQNAILARRCLETMNAELSFNACGLDTSAKLNRDIPDIEARVRGAISSQLSYASEFWSGHLTQTPPDVLESLLHELMFGPKLMYWMEVLSLLGKLMVAPASLLRVVKWCTDNNLQECQATAYDAYRFVLAFYDPISASAPHLYISALPMAPTNSYISKRMATFFSNTLTVLDGLASDWTPCIRSISAGSPVYSLAVSPDDQRIVCGCRDGTLRIWDAETGEAVLLPLKGHSGPVTCVSYSHDGQRIVSGSSDETIRIWNAQTGNNLLEPLLGHKGSVNAVAWSQDDSTIVSGSEDRTVRLWHSSTGAALFEPLEGHSSSVDCVAFSANNLRVASGSANGILCLWDAKNGRLLSDQLDKRAHRACIRFSDDSNSVISESGTILHTWNTTTGASATQSHPDTKFGVQSAAFSPSGNRVACAYKDFQLVIWDAKTGLAKTEPLSGHSGLISSVAFPRSDSFVVSGSFDSTVRIWSINASQRPVSSALPTDTPRMLNSLVVSFSSDGRLIASGNWDCTVWVWDAETGESVLGPLEGLSEVPGSIAFSEDDSLVYCGSLDGGFCTWDVRSGRLVHKTSMQGDPDVVEALAISPDGQLFVSGSPSGEVRIWNATSGKLLVEPLAGHSGRAKVAAFSADGRRIVSGSHDKTVRVWDVQSGSAVLESLVGHSKTVLAVAYSFDGLRIASGSADSTVCIWDAQTGNMLLKLQQGGTAKAHTLAFSHNNRSIISGSDDGILRIWDTESGERLYQCFLGCEGFSSSISISSNDCYVVTTMTDGFLHVVDARLWLRPDLPAKYLPGIFSYV